MKQGLSTYEAEIMAIGSEKTPQCTHSNPSAFRYGQWMLPAIIERQINRKPKSIKWMGNDPNAHILSFFYCLLQSCLHQEHRNEQLFFKLKHSLYQESKRVLNPGEQKYLVEHMCLLQYSTDVAEFLKNSCYLETLLIKIFNLSRPHTRNQNQPSISQGTNKFTDLKRVSLVFPFLKCQMAGNRCVELFLNKKTYYIVEEKSCFFVVEALNQSQSSHYPAASQGHKNLQKRADQSKIKQYSSNCNLASASLGSPTSMRISLGTKTSSNQFDIPQQINSPFKSSNSPNKDKNFSFSDSSNGLQQKNALLASQMSTELKETEEIEDNRRLFDNMRKIVNKNLQGQKVALSLYHEFMQILDKSSCVSQSEDSETESEVQKKKGDETCKKSGKFGSQNEPIVVSAIQNLNMRPKKAQSSGNQFTKIIVPKFMTKVKNEGNNMWSPRSSPKKDVTNLNRGNLSPGDRKDQKVIPLQHPHSNFARITAFSPKISPKSSSKNLSPKVKAHQDGGGSPAGRQPLKK